MKPIYHTTTDGPWLTVVDKRCGCWTTTRNLGKPVLALCQDHAKEPNKEIADALLAFTKSLVERRKGAAAC